MSALYKRTLKHRIALFLAFFSLVFAELSAQTYNDGPIQLIVKVREVQTRFDATDESLLGIGFAPDELTYYVWARDNGNVDALGWLGGTCLTDNFNPSVGGTPSQDFNTTIFNTTYPGATVPMYFDLRLDAWEDDLPSDNLAGFCNTGTRCTYQTPQCCGVILFGSCIGITTGDDYRCDANPFLTAIDYRQGNPCEWYDWGFLPGSCPSNNFYRPHIQTYWRYTRGTSCANAIDLGSIIPGFSPIQHFNSNVCYANNWASSPGNDVFYSFTITQPMGVNVSLCSSASFDTYLYLLDQNCVALTSNDNFCGNTSEISYPLCAPGTYYFVVDAATAAAMGTFTVTLSEDPGVIVNADAGPNQAVCFGQTTLIGNTPAATGGVPGYTYSWTPTTGLSNPGIANPVAFPSTTTQYVLTVTDALGCVVTDTMTVIVNPGPPINLGPDQTVCPGSNILLDAGSGYITYFWSQGSSSQTINVTQPGTYEVLVIDINGCIGRDTVVIQNYASAFVNIGADTSICQGASLTLDAGSGFSTYNWSNSGTNQTTSVTTAGTYNVTVTDGNGCTDADTITVGVNALPTPNLGPDVTLCPGDDATFDPGPGYVVYDWTGGGSNQTMITNVPGTYTVTVTDVNGCQGTDDIQLLNYPGASVTISGPNTVCAGQSITLDAGPGATSYNWSTGATTQTISVIAAGSYMVTVTDGNGCEGFDTVTVTQNAIPVVSLGNDTTICSGATVTLDAGPGTAYIWNTGATTQTITTGSAGGYSVTVTDGNGCEGSATVAVLVSPTPVVNLGPGDTLCAGASTLLDAGGGFNSYAWNTGANTQSINVTAGGSYTVTVTNGDNCPGSATVFVAESNIPGVSLGPDTMICDSGDVLLDAGPVYVAYDWNPPLSNNQYLIVGNPGTYVVTVTDQYGCQSTDDINVVANGSVPGNFLPDSLIKCPEEDLILDAGDQWVYYNWITGDKDQYQLVDTGGTFSVTVIDENGCRFMDTTVVTEEQVPVLELGTGGNVCEGESVTLDAGAGFTSYLWSTGDNTQTITVTAEGLYSVVVTFNSCTYEDEANFTSDCEGSVFIPNVFSPNSDGSNDFFQIKYTNLDLFDYMNVYDRWGNLLFTTGNRDFQWDGKVNGNELPEGVYYYVCRFLLNGAEENDYKIEKGNVTLMR